MPRLPPQRRLRDWTWARSGLFTAGADGSHDPLCCDRARSGLRRPIGTLDSTTHRWRPGRDGVDMERRIVHRRGSRRRSRWHPRQGCRARSMRGRYRLRRHRRPAAVRVGRTSRCGVRLVETIALGGTRLKTTLRSIAETTSRFLPLRMAVAKHIQFNFVRLRSRAWLR